MKKCKYCKTEIDEKAKICPNCKKKQKKIPTWLIIVAAIVVIGIIATSGSDENTENNSTTNESTITEKKEYIKVTVDQLEDELENNAAAAKEKYNNKYVEVSGKLGTIDSDMQYISLLSETDEWDLLGIHCTIKNDSQRNKVKQLTKDQKLTIKGKITDVGEVLGYYLNVEDIISR